MLFFLSSSILLSFPLPLCSSLGGYLGLCAGAYIGSWDDDGTPWNWSFARAELLDLEHWARGKTDDCKVCCCFCSYCSHSSRSFLSLSLCQIAYSKTGQQVLCNGISDKELSSYEKDKISGEFVMTMRYANGPLFLPVTGEAYEKRKTHVGKLQVGLSSSSLLLVLLLFSVVVVVVRGCFLFFHHHSLFPIFFPLFVHKDLGHFPNRVVEEGHTKGTHGGFSCHPC
jgi:hypothetical protein